MNKKLMLAVALLAMGGVAVAEEAAAPAAAADQPKVVEVRPADPAAMQAAKQRRQMMRQQAERPLMMAFTKETKPEEVEAFKKSVLEKIDAQAKTGEGMVSVMVRSRARGPWMQRPNRPQPHNHSAEAKPAAESAEQK